MRAAWLNAVVRLNAAPFPRERSFRVDSLGPAMLIKRRAPRDLSMFRDREECRAGEAFHGEIWGFAAGELPLLRFGGPLSYFQLITSSL